MQAQNAWRRMRTSTRPVSSEGERDLLVADVGEDGQAGRGRHACRESGAGRHSSSHRDCFSPHARSRARSTGVKSSSPSDMPTRRITSHCSHCSPAHSTTALRASRRAALTLNVPGHAAVGGVVEDGVARWSVGVLPPGGGFSTLVSEQNRSKNGSPTAPLQKSGRHCQARPPPRPRARTAQPRASLACTSRDPPARRRESRARAGHDPQRRPQRRVDEVAVEAAHNMVRWAAPDARAIVFVGVNDAILLPSWDAPVAASIPPFIPTAGSWSSSPSTRLGGRRGEQRRRTAVRMAAEIRVVVGGSGAVAPRSSIRLEASLASCSSSALLSSCCRCDILPGEKPASAPSVVTVRLAVPSVCSSATTTMPWLASWRMK